MTFAPPIRAFQKILGATERSLEERLHGAILVARKAGQLDLANKLSEFLHWSRRRYNPNLIGKLLKGVPPLPKEHL